MRTVFILFLMSILHLGCHKDLIITDISDVTDSPAEIGSVNIEGVIKDYNGVNLPNTTVSVFQNNLKAGMILSDNVGRYSTSTIPLDPDLPLTIEFQKNNLNIKYRRILPGSDEIITINPVMGKSTQPDIQIDNFVFQNPSDSNLVKIYGFTKLADGTPVKGVKCSAVWDFTTFGNGLMIHQNSRDYTDENGYFELLVPKNTEIFFNVTYIRYYEDPLGQCHIEFQNLTPNTLEKWNFNHLGIIQADKQILLREDISLDLIMVTVKGKALFCNGNPVQTGILRGYLGPIMGNEPEMVVFGTNRFIDSSYVFGPNGEFEFYIEGCRKENKEYGIIVNIESENFEVIYEEFNLENADNLPPINLCIDNRDFPDVFDLQLGSDPVKKFINGGDRPTSGEGHIISHFEIQNGNLKEIITFEVENIHLGKQPIKLLKLQKSILDPGYSYWRVYETTFDSAPDDVELNITKIEDQYVYGTISGNVDTVSGNKSINITFEIYNK